METRVTLASICVPSNDIVARLIEGDLIIVPLTSCIGNIEDELYVLNETSQAIWQKTDGQRTLRDISEMLADEFNAQISEIEDDVCGFASEMAQRGFLIAMVEGQASSHS
ncbi:MAG: PqqD family protein [Anaerolineaceae bacterium]|nr:PqqD family protein [Anaerolineaceae bacterium]